MNDLLFFLILVCSPVCLAAHSLSDEELSAIQGQALFAMTYIGPGELGNTNKLDGSTSNNLGFYRLGLEADLELNANIKRLQLGCGGIKGAGCDIDLENVRITGINTGADGTYMTSDAVLTNPFIELAIKNPTTAATREVVGMRLGAMKALGKLSIGENPNVNNMADDTGIKSITGDMTIRLTNARLTDVCVTVFGVCTIDASPGIISSHTQSLVLRRATTASLTKMSTSAIGLTLSNTNLYNQPLRTVHQMNVSKSDGTATEDFYISVQKTDITWQKLSSGNFSGTPAEAGWWMSVPDVHIPNMTTNQPIRVSTLSVIGGLFGGAVDVDPVDLQQTPVKNCFGSTSFC